MENDNKSYGEIFKTIRLSKGRDEKKACTGVCSRSTLRCFEVGGNVIKFHTFIKLLKNIDVLAEEYFDAFKNCTASSTDNKFPSSYPLTMKM
ncbi:MAG: hypothetical protein LBI41_02120 [Lactobacillales bacterium]|jgi:hypothetical protein|nr:hypothetical protein [Lactobacillales bacterium]